MPKDINAAKIVAIILIGFFALSGCDTSYSTSEIVLLERCYGGVVYLKEKTGQSNLSVKFNPDSTVSTTLSNGISCLKTY